MKSFIKLLSACSIAVTLSAAMCDNNSKSPDPEPKPSSICESGLVTHFVELRTDYKWDVEKVNATKTLTKTDIKYDFEADSKNNIAVMRKSYAADSKYAGLVETIRFEYDQDGFVKSRKTTLTNYSNIDTYRIKDGTYEYKNGLIVKESGNYTDYTSTGVKETFPYSDTYEYDAAGRLTRETDIFNHFRGYAYSGDGKLTKYFWGDDGKETSQTFEERTFENGYTTRMFSFFNEGETLYKYDALGQMIENSYTQKKVWQGLYRYEYDDKKLPVFWDNPMALTTVNFVKFKGYPDSPPVFGRYIHNKNLTMDRPASSKFYIRQIAEFSYNSDGYPTKMDETLNMSGREIPETTFSRTFEYCK